MLLIGFPKPLMATDRKRLSISFFERLARRSTLKDSTLKLAIKLPLATPCFKLWKVIGVFSCHDKYPTKPPAKASPAQFGTFSISSQGKRRS